MALSGAAKLLYFFVQTHTNSTAIGAFRATIVGLSAELRWPEKKGRLAFRELQNAGLIEYDPNVSYIGLPGFLKDNQPENPNVVKSWKRSYILIPDCPLKLNLLNRMSQCAEGMGEAFLEAFRQTFKEFFRQGGEEGSDNPKQQQSSETASSSISSSSSIPKNKSRKKPVGFLESLGEDSEILAPKNVSKLLALLEAAKDPELPHDDFETKVRIVGASVRAMTAKNIRSPLAVFVSIVRDRDWSKISDDQRQVAKSLVEQWQARQRSPDVAAILGGIFSAEDAEAATPDLGLFGDIDLQGQDEEDHE